ncbi:MAG: Ig-like domain-containing protein [Patescibacteria group bacterium]
MAHPSAVFAQTVDPGLNQVGAATGLETQTDLPTIIGRIINIFLGFMGVILLGIIVYAGYLWMTSGGDNEQVEKAKKLIRNAIIGLIIIVSSFAITAFVINLLTGENGGGGGAGSGNPFENGGGFPGSAGSLGAGIVESHIPARDATGVPRNTAIVITFKEPIKLSSIIAGYNDNNTPSNLADDAGRATTIGLNADVVKIYPAGKRDLALTTAQARVSFTDDRQTFVIRPVQYLGSPTVDTDYAVEFVGGANGLKREDGSAAFGGSFSAGYKWQFQVSTIVDNTPPRITSVIPVDGGSYAPNVIIQMQFNEAVDPVSASGLFQNGSGFTNVQVTAGGTTRPNGSFKLSNQYRTLEFTTDQSCGTNSCGSTVYCLPSSAAIAVVAKSPTLSENPPMAAISGSLYDGIVDLAGNALDGNGDGKAQGSDGDAVAGNDDYGWTFQTTDKPNLAAPVIKSTTPRAGDAAASSNLSVDAKVEATFDSPLRSSTVNTDEIKMETNEPVRMADTFWWTAGYEPLTSAGSVAGVGDTATQGKISVDHRLFVSATGTGATAVVPIYQPKIGSGIQNIYQNCYVPAASVSCVASAQNPNCCDGHPQAGGCAAPTRLP